MKFNKTLMCILNVLLIFIIVHFIRNYYENERVNNNQIVQNQKPECTSDLSTKEKSNTNDVQKSNTDNARKSNSKKVKRNNPKKVNRNNNKHVNTMDDIQYSSFYENNENNEDNETNATNEFELLEHQGGESITGKIKNVSGRDYSYVSVSINILDEEGNVIDSTFDCINNLRDNQVWSFSAPVLVEGRYIYEINEISGY